MYLIDVTCKLQLTADHNDLLLNATVTGSHGRLFSEMTLLLSVFC